MRTFLPSYRITPAPAGKTNGSQSFTSATRDHPRTCGENLFSFMENGETLGSPPHLRGKRFDFNLSAYDHGITPAPAGKTRTNLRKNYRREDHPRTCGENFTVCSANNMHKGSPPHLRGKLFFKARSSSSTGITPAPAGKTGLRKIKPPTNWDHPRTCGENAILTALSWNETGSPPHLRGKR